MGERTRRLLLTHYQTYPKLQVQDTFKFLYQSAFGCEHLVSSVDTATESIENEWNCVDEKHGVEPLDGAYSRVPLTLLNRGLSASTFGKLFVFSAKKEENGLKKLKEKLKIARELVADGALPFSSESFDAAVATWEEKGFSAVHHSEIFRKTYHPSYRVIANAYIPFLPLFCELDAQLKKGRVIVAVEGGSAAGKTTLGKMLAELYGGIVFHMDDFFLRPEQRTETRYAEIGGNVDRERFAAEVLQPLKKGETVLYRKFNCSTMRLEEGETISPTQLTVVEGAYSMHPELEPYYDFSVFLDITPALQKERILKRNSPVFAKRFFDEWIPMETAYFHATNAKQRCHMIIKI